MLKSKFIYREVKGGAFILDPDEQRVVYYALGLGKAINNHA